MQSRTYLRIEGDLVSLVTEMIDREVELSDLLAELPPADQSPAGCPPAPASGSAWASARSSSSSRRRCGGPSSTTRAARRIRADHLSDRAAVRRVRRLDRRPDRGPRDLTSGRPPPLDRRSALSLDPAEHVRRWARLSRLGQGQRATVGERVDALIGAFWASRFNQDLRRHPLPFCGGFRAWASRSRRDPLAALSMAYDPYWRTLRQVVGLDGRRGRHGPPDPAVRTPTPRVRGRDPMPEPTFRAGSGGRRR